MLKVKIFIFTLFIISAIVAFGSGSLINETDVYVKALLIYLLFSCIYSHLRITNKSGNTSIEYGIVYSLSFGIFTGPLGLFLFETIYRFIVYFNKKRTNTADPTEFIDTFYNIGAFTLNCSIAYYLYEYLYPHFQNIPFGFWMIMILLVCVISLLSDIYLTTFFIIEGEIKTFREVIDFIKTRSVMDMGKLALTNGLLLLFLQEEKWETIFCLFVLNYIVSRSFISKSQNIQNKIERDKFEQMAYTDFLTGVHNRAFMDKKMSELNETSEIIGIIVADIDKFKSINDNYNHAVGDRVIQHFSTTLKGYLNKDDFLFRSGGEEFTIFLRNRNYEQCEELVEKILHGIKNSSVNVHFKKKEISISYTASFGLYYCMLNEEISIEKGYVHADHLLLQSKQLGKNRVTVKNGLANGKIVQYEMARV
ncbi:GGDEF domain-containing protein [Bacillus sp. CGMCC 1.16607]|uniref:GGDEF domain-containing protein n=1 Tax=Bacillus sp. CGMCC 1.16607 TaxID=3351842 RepID=UPI00363E55E4